MPRTARTSPALPGNVTESSRTARTGSATVRSPTWGRARRAHVLALAQRDRHAAHDPRRDHPQERREQDDEDEPRLAAERRRQDRDDEERGQDEEQVDEPHERAVDPAAEVARERSDERG